MPTVFLCFSTAPARQAQGGTEIRTKSSTFLRRIAPLNGGWIRGSVGTAYGDAETERQALHNRAEAMQTKPIDFKMPRSQIDMRIERAA